MSDLIESIMELKAKRKAVILAHNYVKAEVQDIADFVGDSLELSIKAKNSDAPVIVFCGVQFMAETAKILSPHATVLLPVATAGCPMADMAEAEKVAEFRKNHPDTVLVAYVNSTAAVKAEIDICCTSANAERVIQSIPADKEIMFLPDRNLGANVSRKLNRPMKLWPGFCPTHERITPEMVESARAAHPGAVVILHPECPPDTVAKADFALSTGGMLRKVGEMDCKAFIIGTESGILHRMRKENPDKEFFAIVPEPLCPNMKKISLQDVYVSLRDMVHKVELPRSLMDKARLPIEKMLNL